MVRRMDRQGEVLIWCRKCSGCARQRVGPNLMNCCKPKEVGTNERGKMLQRIQLLEDGAVPCQGSKKLEDGRTKEENHWKGIQKIVE